jgi:hypothetical protein
MSTEQRYEQFGGLTYTEWAAKHDAERDAQNRANPPIDSEYVDMIFGFIQLAFLGGLLWGFVALVKFFWMHS